MRVKATIPWLLLIVSSFAGCVGGDAAPAAAPSEVPLEAAPAEFGADTGAIEGFVHDDQLLPLAGAQVGLIGTDVPIATSAADGKFVFSNLPPGTYPLAAQMLGYESASKSVTVAAGEPTVVDITLIAIAIVEPYSEVLSEVGLLGCSASWRPAPPPPANYVGISLCGDLDTLGLDEFTVFLKLTGKPTEWMGTVYELHWKSTQAMGRGLSAPFETDGCWNVRDSRWARLQGYSPLRAWHSLEQHAEKWENNTKSGCNTKDRCNEKKCTIGVRIFSNPDTLGASSPADVGVTIQQTFTAYMSVFYNGPAPEQWSAVGDT